MGDVLAGMCDPWPIKSTAGAPRCHHVLCGGREGDLKNLEISVDSLGGRQTSDAESTFLTPALGCP